MEAQNEKIEYLNFIEEIITEDLEKGKHKGRVLTRFPPEPNGYLHIGHTKAICTNFEIAKKFGGKTNLRFDDTNPTTENTEFVEAIKKDINWLGYEWEGKALFASDYFEDLYGYALKLINSKNAYVDDSTAEEIALQKGKPNNPGTLSPFRNRTVEENLDLFAKMKAGKFPDGSKVLRAKIDMSSANMHMRDPVIYRIKHQTHHRTGDKWCIYPMYDFAHGQSDSLEKITHSLCSLEFIHHRPLYNWFIEKLDIFPSRQIEFARMNVGFMITSKRKLLRLIKEGYVKSWDDPRMPTISGMRRRGFPAKALRSFCHKVGLAKRYNLIEIGLLESCIREELNKISDRVHAVLNPLKLIITNYQEKEEYLKATINPEVENSKSRQIPFSKEIYIEREDFMIDAPKKFFRLGPGKTVRLKHAYIITCKDFKVDKNGIVNEVYCEYYPDSKSGQDTSGIKAKGTLHWVSVNHAIEASVNVYDRLFTVENPTGDSEKDFVEFYNENSHKVIEKIFVEPFLKEDNHSHHLQFMRKGYFVKDYSSKTNSLCFNQTISLLDSWAKKNKK